MQKQVFPKRMKRAVTLFKTKASNEETSYVFNHWGLTLNFVKWLNPENPIAENEGKKTTSTKSVLFRFTADSSA